MRLRGLRVNARTLEGLSPAELAQVREELRFLDAALKENPLEGYAPHGKQVTFHRPPFPRSRLFLGGNRSGKTTATMVDTLLQCVDAEVVPEHLLPYKRWEPPFYGRVVTPDLTNTLEGVVLQKVREWCPKKQLRGGSFDRAYDKVSRVLRFKNDSWLQFLSNDQDLDKFGGAALHRVVYDEEPRGDIRRECLMRLLDYGGEEMFGMTPLHGMSWVYDEFFAPWESGLLRNGRIVVVDMDDNPHLDEATKEWVLSGLSEEERSARKSGRFVSFAGLIYGQFTRRRHVLPMLDAEADDSPLRTGAEVFCGIDPGIRNMCGVIFAYLDSNDHMVVFDEIAAKDMTIRQVCDEIRMRCLRWHVTPQWYVLDPSARNRSGQTGRSDQQEFADNGIYTIPAQNAVTAGINRVRERLERDRLQVTANCLVLLDEFRKYRWVRDTNRSENEPQDKPVKKDDHLLDALRYVVMARPLAPDRELTRPTDSTRDRLLRQSLKGLRRMSRVPVHDSGPGIFN